MEAGGAHWRRAKLPPLYGLAVYFWLTVFAGISAGLCFLYVGFVLSGASGLLRALERGEGQSSQYISSLLILLAGSLLLAAFLRAITIRPKFSGVSVPPDRYEDLRTLITECAAAAGIPPPEGLYLTPDMAAAAYTAGRLSLTRQGQRDAVFIGAAALLLMPRSDLKAILLHEFAHLALRRRVLAADICNKIYDFIPRFARAHRHTWAAIVTIIPSIIFAILWWAFKKTMQPLSRAEELVVDRCAADIVSEHHYASALARLAVLHTAIQMQARQTAALLTDINAAFYRFLLEARGPNWFDTARCLLADRRDDLGMRIEMAKDRLAVAPRREAGTHPSLTVRVSALDQELDVLLATLGQWEGTGRFEPDLEAELSAEFAVRLRPWFYSANMAASDGLPLLAPHASLDFVCLRKNCPRSGQPELSLSDNELRLYGKAKPVVIPWTEVGLSKVVTQTNGFLSEIAVNIMAEIREAPSNRTLIIQLRKGKKIVVPHWHCGSNALEIEAWIEHFVDKALGAAGIDPAKAAKAADKISGTGLAMATVWVLVVMFCMVVITMTIGTRYGYQRGSAVQTILIIAAITWVMGRRR